jgi:hypothetical protein
VNEKECWVDDLLISPEIARGFFPSMAKPNKVMDVRLVRGQGHPRICEYLVLSEFDIDSGSTVSHRTFNSFIHNSAIRVIC